MRRCGPVAAAGIAIKAAALAGAGWLRPWASIPAWANAEAGPAATIATALGERITA